MNELEKTEIRNYLSGAGFLVIAAYLLYGALHEICALELRPPDLSLYFGIPLIVLGVLLSVLKKRDLSAISFLMMGLIFVMMNFRPVRGYSDNVLLTIGLFLLILSCVTLTAKDKAKYLIFLLPLFFGLSRMMLGAGLADGLAILAACLIGGLIALYFTLAVSSERIRLPFAPLLKEESSTEFKTNGSVLGYLIFGMFLSVDAVYYFTAGVGTPLENLVMIKMIGGAMLCLVAVLLWTIAGMKYTPAMFFMMGFLIFLGSQIANSTAYAGVVVASPVFYLIAVLMAVVCFITLLRNESRILPAMMILFTAVSYALLGLFSSLGSPALQGVFALIPALISVYLAFAVVMQSGKLKLI